MKPTRCMSVVGALLLPVTLALLTSGGCKKDDDADTPTTAAPAPTPAPTPTPIATVVPEEDAGSDASDASDGDASDAKPMGVSNLTRCCNAIKANAKSAPPEQQLLYGAAIQICNSGVIPPQFRNLPQCK